MLSFSTKSKARLRGRKALRAAEMLDEVVDSQLPLVTELSETSRRRSADYLSELVMLAQDYRHYAAGWIDHEELQRRATPRWPGWSSSARSAGPPRSPNRNDAALGLTRLS